MIAAAIVLVAAVWIAIRSGGAPESGATPTPSTSRRTQSTAEPALAVGDEPTRATTPESDAPPSPAQAVAPGDVAPPAARLLAHLVDFTGAGRPNSPYLLVPLGEEGCLRPRSAWIERVSDGGGRIDERELAPGPWRVWFAPTYCAPVACDVRLIAGDNDLGLVRFPTVVEAGAVRVELARGELKDSLGGVLSLRSLDGLSVDRWNHIGEGPWMRRFGSDERDSSFSFEHLPAGEYEVRLYVEHGQAFDRLSARAHVPGEAVVFRRLDELDRFAVMARIRDARTAQPIAAINLIAFDARNSKASEYYGGFGEQLTLLPRGDDRRWFALAEQYGCVEFGPATLRPVDGVVTLAGELRSGFGAVILARDADALLRTPGVGHESGLRRDHGPALADVAILADGVVVARTDVDGLAVVNLPAAPRELRAELPGRCLVDTENLRDGRVHHAHSLVQFWLARP